jgi:hypothetical protein
MAPFQALFLKLISFSSLDYLQQIFTPETLVLYSENKSELKEFQERIKNLTKHKERVSIIGENNCVGLLECAISCPYWTTSLTCLTNNSVYYKIHKDDLFRRIESDTQALMQLMKQKLMLLSKLLLTHSDADEKVLKNEEIN